jgi:hypothetical protein
MESFCILFYNSKIKLLLQVIFFFFFNGNLSQGESNAKKTDSVNTSLIQNLIENYLL